MNKQTMHAIRKQGQAGFTLIELIVVIVILGILAATALPKFANLTGDARVASLNSARGAILGTAATAHGQWLIDPAGRQTSGVTSEGTLVSFATTVVSGYPLANTQFPIAAGLNATDYKVIVGTAAATANSPAVAAHQFVVIPNSAAGTTTGLTCYISYLEPTALNTAPIVSSVPTAANCQ